MGNNTNNIKTIVGYRIVKFGKGELIPVDAEFLTTEYYTRYVCQTPINYEWYVFRMPVYK